MLLQSYLRAGNTLESLTEKYSINLSWSKKHPELVLFKYDQIDSPMGEPIVQESHGVILNSKDWSVVSRPFDKFFNYGEGHAAKIDWSTARVQEKVDGSLIQLYNYQNNWLVGTSGHPDAGGQVNEYPFTFEELFRSNCKLDFSLLNPEFCYLFELTSMFNRIVVRHVEPGIKLLAIRAKTGAYQPIPPELQSLAVKEFPLQTIDQLLETFKTINPLQQEGYVVVDSQSNRVKVKHPGYVAIHHIRDSFGPKRALEIIRLGETTELLAHFPEYQSVFDDIQLRYNVLVEDLEEEYRSIKDIPSQKEFALFAVKTRLSAVLFSLRSGKVKSVKEYLSEMNLDTLMSVLGLK